MARANVLAARLPGEWPRGEARLALSPILSRPLDYWGWLRHVWAEPRTLVNVEHDMELTDALVDDLLACPHPLCTHAYLLYYPTTHQHEPHYAQNVSTAGCHPPIGNIVHYTARGIRWIDEGEEWADFSGPGFCKIAPEARTQPLPEATWSWVEMSVNASVGCRWHVHWPGAAHYHQ